MLCHFRSSLNRDKVIKNGEKMIVNEGIILGERKKDIMKMRGDRESKAFKHGSHLQTKSTEMIIQKKERQTHTQKQTNENKEKNSSPLGPLFNAPPR